jgi:hypothetical protein
VSNRTFYSRDVTASDMSCVAHDVNACDWSVSVCHRLQVDGSKLRAVVASRLREGCWPCAVTVHGLVFLVVE